MAVVKLKNGKIIDTEGMEQGFIDTYVIPQVAPDNRETISGRRGATDSWNEGVRLPGGQISKVLPGGMSEEDFHHQDKDFMQPVKDWLGKPNKEGTSPQDRITAGGVGLMTGGPLGGALNAAFPPKTPGDWAMMGALHAMPTGKILDKAKDLSGMGKVALQGLLGYGNMQAGSAVKEGVDRLANPNGPKGDFLMDPRKDPLSTALSTLMPATGQFMVNRRANLAPSSVSARLIEKLTGQTDPSKVSEMQQLDPTKTMEGAGGALAAMQSHNPAPLQQQIMNEMARSQGEEKRIGAGSAQQILQDVQGQQAQQAQARQAQQAVLPQQQQNAFGLGQVKAALAGEKVNQAGIKFDAAMAQIEQLQAQPPTSPRYPMNPTTTKFFGKTIDQLTIQALEESTKIVSQARHDMREAQKLGQTEKYLKANNTLTSEEKVIATRNAQIERMKQMNEAAAQQSRVAGAESAAQLAKSKEIEAELRGRATGLQTEDARLKGKVRDAKAFVDPSEKPIIQAQKGADIGAEKSYQADLQDTLTQIQNKAGTYEAMHAGVRRLAWEAPKGSGRTLPTVEDMINGVAGKDTTADEVTGLMTHLGHSGQVHVDNFRKAMTEKFMQMAYDIRTGNMTNAPELMVPEGPFNMNKLAAIYSTTPNSPKMTEFKRAVDDIAALGKDPGGLQHFAKSAGSHAAWILGTSLAIPSTALSGKAAFAGGAFLLSVAWPKLIDKMLTNPTFGKQFHAWATGTDRSVQSLRNWPRLAAQLKSMAVPATPEEQAQVAQPNLAPTPAQPQQPAQQPPQIPQ